MTRIHLTAPRAGCLSVLLMCVGCTLGNEPLDSASDVDSGTQDEGTSTETDGSGADDGGTSDGSGASEDTGSAACVPGEEIWSWDLPSNLNWASSSVHDGVITVLAAEMDASVGTLYEVDAMSGDTLSETSFSGDTLLAPLWTADGITSTEFFIERGEEGELFLMTGVGYRNMNFGLPPFRLYRYLSDGALAWVHEQDGYAPFGRSVFSDGQGGALTSMQAFVDGEPTALHVAANGALAPGPSMEWRIGAIRRTGSEFVVGGREAKPNGPTQLSVTSYDIESGEPVGESIWVDDEIERLWNLAPRQGGGFYLAGYGGTDSGTGAYLQGIDEDGVVDWSLSLFDPADAKHELHLFTRESGAVACASVTETEIDDIEGVFVCVDANGNTVTAPTGAALIATTGRRQAMDDDGSLYVPVVIGDDDVGDIAPGAVRNSLVKVCTGL